MKKVKEGMYELGIVKSGDISSTIIINLNKGTIVFNNFNRGNAGSWSDIVKIIDIMKNSQNYSNEKWYQLYKKFIKRVSPEEYNTMVEKMNMGII